ncbi:FAD-binding and (Fe-S)-binding domain-containing protein [Aldersonia kunmingensis]|uniref:FAD-binding and (Fe-S)-binding domain-containing protein n=1 Tax=Aldersonia kunmingensis TaxID=408066 RepID=UPI00082D1D02|nr:FAD-binding and (Fe-S)-binding domain-containing protein [Aldersonia kunmingensis]
MTAARIGLPLAHLRAQLAGDVDDSPRRRAEYSSDASNYRVPPLAVVFPRSGDDVAATLDFARSHGVTLTGRGGGTSVAGNAIGPGLVLDFSRHLGAVLELDPDARRAIVQPGIVLADLQRAAGVHGLRFGPDPSTASRATVGGMIGNNACGPRAAAWGRTSDNVVTIRILDGSGTERVLGPGLDGIPGLDRFVQHNLAAIRTGLGHFDRQASGYSLEHLLPERDPNTARAFVGTEGTCGLILDATIDLVPIPRATTLVVLGYPDLATAAEDTATVLEFAPTAIEGLDARLVDVVRTHRGAVPDLPRGDCWLFVEVAGESPHESSSHAAGLAAAAHALDARAVHDRAEAATLWRIRADGAGLAGRTPDGAPAWPGWEDAAVPQRNLAAYLRDFAVLTHDHGVDGLLYGHFGDGCIHVRLDLPISHAPQRFREFLVDAAKLVAAHGGSLSGEHGDGRARSELLPLMYAPEVIAAFEGFKGIFDPDNVLNPGVLVTPRPVDADLRLAAIVGKHDPDLSAAVHRCVGVGKCRSSTADGGFMCPSYRATRDERDSTRGRARVLQEVINGSLLAPDWSSTAVEESLDLCLSCKACAADCPAGVDMAAYKAEVLHRRYRRRVRPVTHYSLGWLPRWLRAARAAPRAANVLARRDGLRRLAGVDPRRPAPRLAAEPFRAWWKHHRGHVAQAPVMLWSDTFTNAFRPEVGIAATELLESLGHSVTIPGRQVCCGLTWISTGQLDGARRQLRRTLDALADHVDAGGVVIGLEPSCTAVLRSELTVLLPDDPRVARVAVATRTLAEFLTDQSGWSPPRLDGMELVVQPHCHQYAALGFGPDRALLERTGARVQQISGCCGLAGNFGMERGHYEVSVAVAETGLLPAIRGAGTAALLVADGFSCATQAEQLTGFRGMHLAELFRDTQANASD